MDFPLDGVSAVPGALYSSQGAAHYVKGVSAITATFQRDNLFAHFDASVEESISSVDGRISKWKDISGNDRHAIQNTEDIKPETGVNTQSNKNVITFTDNDGNGQAINLPSDFYLLPNGPHTVFIVCRSTGTTGSMQRIYSMGAGTSLRSAMSYAISDDECNFRNNSGSSLSPNATIDRDEFSIITVSILDTNLYIKINNETELTNTNGAYQATSTNAMIGAKFLASGNGINQYLIGDIAEMLFYDSALSSDEKERIIFYLSNKWRINI